MVGLVVNGTVCLARFPIEHPWSMTYPAFALKLPAADSLDNVWTYARGQPASQCSHFREFTRPALNLRGPSKIDPAKNFWMIFWAWSSLTGKFRSCSTKPGAGTTVEKSFVEEKSRREHINHTVPRVA